MKNTSLKYLVIAVASAFLVACGGGGSSSSSTDTSSSSSSSGSSSSAAAPAPTATPTAVLTSSQSEADKLAAEAKAGLAAAQNAANSSGLPTGVETSSLPSGVAIDYSSMFCSSGTASMDTNATGMPTAGTKISTTYNNCKSKYGTGEIFSGSWSQEYTRYVSANDMAFKITYNNFSMTGGLYGGSGYNGSGTYACDYKGSYSTTSCYFSDGSRSWSSGVSYSGGKASGTYAANYGSGTVTVKYSNFGSVGGTATVTGAAGNTAVITYTSATSYSVAITVNGTTTNYTVAM